MDTMAIGAEIRRLRKEKGLTQKELADLLYLSPKTISKWETGLGAPDITLLPRLSKVLEVDAIRLLEGRMEENGLDNGNMKNMGFYICPVCSSLTMSTGKAGITCCSKPLERLEARKAEDGEKLILEEVEDQWYITSRHPQSKEDFISFIALLSSDRLDFTRLYPEWEIGVRIPRKSHGRLLFYSSSKGLLYQLI